MNAIQKENEFEINDKVAMNTMILPLGFYAVGFNYVALGIMLFFSVGYLIIIPALYLNDKKRVNQVQRSKEFLIIFTAFYIPVFLMLILG